MNKTSIASKNYSRTPWLLLLLVLTGSAVAIFYFHKQYQETQAKLNLSEKVLKAKNESLSEKIAEDSLLRVYLISRFSLDTNSDWTTLSNRELLAQVYSNMNQKERLLKKDYSFLQKKMEDVLFKNEQFFEEKEQVIEEMLSMRSELEIKLIEQLQKQDSLNLQLTNLQASLAIQDFDTLQLVSPSGDPLFYYGKIINNRPAGFGIGFYEGKGYYVGEWNGNFRHGHGKHFYKNGDQYEGRFERDKRLGFGIYYFHSGEQYRGEWQNDLMHGKGEIVTADGKSVPGIWENGKKGKMAE